MICNRTVETVKAELDLARAAYNRLMEGQAVRVIVDSNGERLEFSSVSRSDLYAHILKLEAELNRLTGCGMSIQVPRPIGFLF